MAINARPFVPIILVLAIAAGLVAACGGDSPATPSGETAVPGDTATPGGQTAVLPDAATPGVPSPPGQPAFDEPPETTASAGTQSVEAGTGTYCWTMMCVDKIGVPTKGTLDVSSGDTVRFAVPAGAPALREAAAHIFPAVGELPLEDGSSIWPYPASPGEAITAVAGVAGVDVRIEGLAPGTYVLTVSMYFERGDVVYGVLLDVE